MCHKKARQDRLKNKKTKPKFDCELHVRTLSVQATDVTESPSGERSQSFTT